MKKFRLTLVFIFAGLQLLSARAQDITDIRLKLNQGDRFSYTFDKLWNGYGSKSISTVNGKRVDDYVPVWQKINGRLTIEVEEYSNEGYYLFEYKLDYMVERNQKLSLYTESDSRYPEYGRLPESIAACFLNEVSYKVKFYPEKGQMSILNLEEVKEDLRRYMFSRDLGEEDYHKATDNILTEKRILSRLDFLKIYSDSSRFFNGTNGKNPENIEAFKFVEETDSSFLYKKGSSGTEAAGSIIEIDKMTGLPLMMERIQASSFYTGKGFNDKPDFSGKSDTDRIKLDYYSGNQKLTLLKGKIESIDKYNLVLVNNLEQLGEVDYREISVDSTGNFELILPIERPKRFILWLMNDGTKQNYNSIIASTQLYLSPGDSIYVRHLAKDLRFNLSGKGVVNSRVIDELIINSNLTNLLYFFLPHQQDQAAIFDRIESVHSQCKDNLIKLEATRSSISESLYLLLKAELLSIQKAIDIYYSWLEVRDQIEVGEEVKTDPILLQVPHLPSYPYYEDINHYKDYIKIYARLRQDVFDYYNSGVFKRGQRALEQPFYKVLLQGPQLYWLLSSSLTDYINEGVFATSFVNRDWNYKDFFEKCNHQGSRNYVTDVYSKVDSLGAGMPMPDIELFDIDGRSVNWDDLTGKVIVLLLYQRSTSIELMYSQQLYEKYGKNRRDVMVMRVSPGLDFESWKADVERVSGLYSAVPDFQFFYKENGFEFQKQFLIPRRGNRFLVIDRDGKINRSLMVPQQLKGAIDATLAKPDPPRTPFWQSRVGRILPGMLLGIILTFVFYRIIVLRRIKRHELKTRISDLEHKAIKAQLNPHFLFNCLNSIQNLMNKKQLEDADSYLTSFASLLRKTLDHSEIEELPIAEELETLKLYIGLEQMRFDFDFLLETDLDLDIYNTNMPSLLLQPLVENAILHGLYPKKSDRQLKIHINKQGPSILLSVEDNGLGRKESPERDPIHSGRGLEMIVSRIRLLNEQKKGNYAITMNDLKDAKGNPAGTRVEIIIPDEE